MKRVSEIYWWLFWNFDLNTLNDKVDEAYRKKDWEQVEFFCKVIALRVMKMDKDRFWEREVLGIC